MTICLAVPALANGGAQEWLSPAKVNLWLRVTGKRPDGYHLLDSLMVPVDLCDRLKIAACRLPSGTRPIVEVRADRADIPAGPDNLAWKAAHSVLAACGASARVRVEIEKQVPACAGLGGGSSNAATVIKALDTLLGLGLSPRRKGEIALDIGTDVPFFIGCRPARVRGIGEELEPVMLTGGMVLVVAVPRTRVRTAWAFAQFDRSLTRNGQARNLAPSEGLAWRGAASMRNDLEEVVMGAYPEIRETKEALLAAGARGAVMSGSGSAVVGLAGSASEARAVAGRLAGSLCQAYAVSVLAQGPASRPLEG